MTDHLPDDPPPARRRDESSPAAGHHGAPPLLLDVDAWCRLVLRPAPRRFPRLDDQVDDIAVERACNGDRSITLNRAELEAAWRRLERRGWSALRIGDALAVSPRSVVRWRQGQHHPHPRRTIGARAQQRGLAA